MDLAQWQDRLRSFSEERAWLRFHSPKNLAMALSVEASELVEIFQWLTEAESTAVMGSSEAEHVRQEMADVMIYLLRLADTLDIDLEAAVESKVMDNARRFLPHDRQSGSVENPAL